MSHRDERLQQLMTEWKNTSGYPFFCEDGILIEQAWDAAPVKIMFLLKETYRHFINIKGKELGPRGTSKTFWRRMRMWTHIIETHFQGSVAPFAEVLKIKEEPNKKIAYVNIKKNAEKQEYNKEANSSPVNIHHYAREDAYQLSKQIRLIDPSVIVCCGTHEFTQHFLLNQVAVKPKVFRHERTYLLDMGHLSQRGGYEKNYNQLVEMLAGI